MTTAAPWFFLDSSVLVPEPEHPARQGVVRADGNAFRDDGGIFRPKGCTFFWAMQGSKHERDRIIKHLDFLASYGLHDVRGLGEVDWKDGWHIDPDDPDYETNMGWFMDTAYARGMRTQWTLIGGKQGDTLWGKVIEKVARVVNNGRRHMLSCAEIVNERDRLNKMTFANMEKAGKALRALLPDHLIGLSRPQPKPKKEPENSNKGFKAMFEAMERSGTNLFIQHKRRGSAEFGWDHVSQGYDFEKSKYPGDDNEPEGPQSSDESEDRPLFIALGWQLSAVCGGGKYIFHPGQMVTGHVDPEHGRPANLWEVPRIDECLRAVTAADSRLPDGVENWKVVNNARDDHPLPIPKAGFWYEPAQKNRAPAVNKNYAAISGNHFAMVLTGVRSTSDEPGKNLVHVGSALKRCHVEAFDPVTGTSVDATNLEAVQPWYLVGRKDTEAGYLIRGEYR